MFPNGDPVLLLAPPYTIPKHSPTPPFPASYLGGAITTLTPPTTTQTCATCTTPLPPIATLHCPVIGYVTDRLVTVYCKSCKECSGKLEGNAEFIAGELLNGNEGIMDGSVIIYKVHNVVYYHATGKIGDQRYA